MTSIRSPIEKFISRSMAEDVASSIESKIMAQLPKRTGRARNLAVIEAYREFVSDGPFKISDVVDWALEHRLMPIPTRLDDDETQGIWEVLFADFMARQRS